jgi:hypothetical protein
VLLVPEASNDDVAAAAPRARTGSD